MTLQSNVPLTRYLGCINTTGTDLMPVSVTHLPSAALHFLRSTRVYTASSHSRQFKSELRGWLALFTPTVTAERWIDKACPPCAVRMGRVSNGRKAVADLLARPEPCWLVVDVGGR
ncbi:hypothetical protein B381_20276 [Stutzerimonas stutzeri NF13]|jgi:hypothetical protein|uniref:Uncharacterized protein n=1 Tax=Stutzerimonas stutzeri NF13 TaxID=1212548 RepID=M2UHX6_STUST|nr:hypothetical protein B381_20276 [Stutzerimonas stutzeri NF13]